MSVSNFRSGIKPPEHSAAPRPIVRLPAHGTHTLPMSSYANPPMMNTVQPLPPVTHSRTLSALATVFEPGAQYAQRADENATSHRQVGQTFQNDEYGGVLLESRPTTASIPGIGALGTQSINISESVGSTRAHALHGPRSHLHSSLHAPHNEVSAFGTTDNLTLSKEKSESQRTRSNQIRNLRDWRSGASIPVAEPGAHLGSGLGNQSFAWDNTWLNYGKWDSGSKNFNSRPVSPGRRNSNRNGLYDASASSAFMSDSTDLRRTSSGALTAVSHTGHLIPETEGFHVGNDHGSSDNQNYDDASVSPEGRERQDHRDDGFNGVSIHTSLTQAPLLADARMGGRQARDVIDGDLTMGPIPKLTINGHTPHRSQSVTNDHLGFNRGRATKQALPAPNSKLASKHREATRQAFPEPITVEHTRKVSTQLDIPDINNTLGPNLGNIPQNSLQSRNIAHDGSLIPEASEEQRALRVATFRKISGPRYDNANADMSATQEQSSTPRVDVTDAGNAIVSRSNLPNTGLVDDRKYFIIPHDEGIVLLVPWLPSDGASDRLYVYKPGPNGTEVLRPLGSPPDPVERETSQLTAGFRGDERGPSNAWANYGNQHNLFSNSENAYSANDHVGAGSRHVHPGLHHGWSLQGSVNDGYSKSDVINNGQRRQTVSSQPRLSLFPLGQIEHPKAMDSTQAWILPQSAAASQYRETPPAGHPAQTSKLAQKRQKLLLDQGIGGHSGLDVVKSPTGTLSYKQQQYGQHQSLAFIEQATGFAPSAAGGAGTLVGHSKDQTLMTKFWNAGPMALVPHSASIRSTSFAGPSSHSAPFLTWNSSLSKDKQRTTAPTFLNYRPGTDTMFPAPLYGYPSPPFQRLTCAGQPTYETAMLPENLPFVQATTLAKPAHWGVVKIGSIPYAVTRQDILAFLGKTAKIIPADMGPAIHVMMDRASGKTLDAYVEFLSPMDAQAFVNKVIFSIESDHRSPKLCDRHVAVEMSSQGQLMKDLFPKAKNVGWDGQVPVIVGKTDVYNSGFKCFITKEELVTLVRHAEQPNRFNFAHRSYNRSYENMISILHKFPWFAVDLYTLGDCETIYEALLRQVMALVGNLQKSPVPNLTEELVYELVYAGLNAPGFSEQMKWRLWTAVAPITEQVRMSPVSGVWPWVSFSRKAGCEEDVVIYYARIHSAAFMARVGNAPSHGELFQQGELTWKGVSPDRTMKAACEEEWKELATLVARVLGAQ